jgi:hypothetical protein
LNTKRGIDICGFFHAKNVRASCFAPHPHDRALGSFVVNSPLVRYSTSGRIPISLNNKLRCRRSFRPCTKRMSWPSHDGFPRMVWTRKWVSWRRASSIKLIVYYGHKWACHNLNGHCLKKLTSHVYSDAICGRRTQVHVRVAR